MRFEFCPINLLQIKLNSIFSDLESDDYLCIESTFENLGENVAFILIFSYI